MKLNFSLVALFGLLLIAFSIPGVNVYHHLVVPDIHFYKETDYYTYNFSYPFLHKHIDFYLESEIHSQVFYSHIIIALNNAEKGDIITFHLSGYGGDAQTTSYLINNIKQTKAWVIMKVQAETFSAHSYLALSGNELQMSPYSFLMLHMSSIWNLDCSQKTGIDRAITEQQSCENIKKNELEVNTKMIEDMPILTAQEKASLLTGHEVYLSAETVNKRLSK